MPALRVIQGFHIKIYENYSEELPENNYSIQETYNHGDMLEGEILEESASKIDFKFQDGWIALGIPKDCVKKVKEVASAKAI